MTKVSVVVPAYRPGDGIQRVIGSLEKQTMPQEDFEVIIVDDGSPDDTWQRLERIRDTHPNVRIERIENSGWPSRPRNVGIDMARGEYILFMDHDDALFPDGLRASYEYAAQHRADVLSPKESKTSDPSWGITNYTKNFPNARESRGIASLLPMMPHKFYRTAFLREHGIRFPEGRRMLWEDVYFNVAAYRHAEVISILSDTPVYLWVETEQNNSRSYGPEDEEFWQKLLALLRYIAETLPGEEFADARTSMMAHQYRTRVLGRFYTRLGQPGTDWIPMALGYVEQIVRDFVPEEIDDRLPSMARPRSYLLRRGRTDLLAALQQHEKGLSGVSRTSTVAWEKEHLVIEATARWTVAGGDAFTLEERDGRLLRRMPAEIEEFLPERLRDVTDDVQKASSSLTLRDRAKKEVWALPTRTEVRVEPVASSRADGRAADAGSVTVAVVSRSRVDIRKAAGGNPLTAPLWDVQARNTLLGSQNHRALRTRTPVRAALLRGRSAIAYTNRDGNLSLDLAQKVRDVVGYARPRPDLARLTPAGRQLVRFDLPVEEVHTRGRTELSGQVMLTPLGPSLAAAVLSDRVKNVPKAGPALQRALGAKPATLVGDDDGARVEGVFRALPGVYRLAFRFQGRTVTSPLVVRVPWRGLPTLSERREPR